jgi:Rad3-related DNA helicase
MQPYEQIELQKEQKELESLLNKVRIFAKNLDKTWIANIYDRQSEFKPLWLKEDLARQFYWRHARKHVLMSATWPSPAIIAKTLGIPIGDIDMFEVPSIFPVGANPVNLCNIGDMSYKTINESLPRVISATMQIINHHANHKGVIHTGNYKVCDAIMATNNPRLITHNSYNKQEQIERFMSSSRPLVFVSPSSTRGMDLPDDLCRFTITAKAPFQSLGDKFTSGRMYSKPIGKQWYISSCAQEIEQGVGRGMRSANDWCENYILDIAACRMITSNPQLFGQYFLDSREVFNISRLGK